MLREKIKNWKMELAAVLVFVLVLGMTGLSGSVKAADQTDLKTIDIMFVHDTHSHLNSFSTVVDEKQEMIGGFARIKTLIDEQKEKDQDTLVVDGGDFSMGTLVQTVFETQAAEIRMLGALGCEATTLGNHEFDYRSKGLAKMCQIIGIHRRHKRIDFFLCSSILCNVRLDWSKFIFFHVPSAIILLF